MSHSIEGVPGLQFSATMLLGVNAGGRGGTEGGSASEPSAVATTQTNSNRDVSDMSSVVGSVRLQADCLLQADCRGSACGGPGGAASMMRIVSYAHRSQIYTRG